jgi:hypothetical protein
VSRKAIFACANPVNTIWQLGPLSSIESDIMLFGWKPPSEPIDGGMPKEVGVVFAKALVSVARVGFPISKVPMGALETWSNRNEDQVRFLCASNLIERIEAMLKNVPPNVSFLSTRHQETVVKSFEDSFYSWCLQGQVILLSKPEDPPPNIDRRTLLSLIGINWIKQADILSSIGISGILRPGVDGDVIGILFLSNHFKQILLEALAHQARLAEFDWSLLSELDFTNNLREQ